MATEQRLRVLILEDETLISLSLEEIVKDTVPSVVIVRASLEAAREVIEQPFDLALLDIDLTNGQTYSIARMLEGREIPFAFVSATARERLPSEFRGAQLITKPFASQEVEQAVVAANDLMYRKTRNT
jgi:DNA-binding response OmpR family regulator